MSRNPRAHIGAMNDTETDESLRPKHLTKQEFGRRLYRLMLAKGWTRIWRV